MEDSYGVNVYILCVQEWKQCFRVRNLLNLVGKCAKMEGFLVKKYLNRMDKFLEEMTRYIKEGKIKYKEDVKELLGSFQFHV